MNSSIKGSKKMDTTEKNLQTMNSWHWGELIVGCWKICLRASSHSSEYISGWTVLKIMSLYKCTISISVHSIRCRVSTSKQSPIFFYFFTSHLMLLYKTKQLLYSDRDTNLPQPRSYHARVNQWMEKSNIDVCKSSKWSKQWSMSKYWRRHVQADVMVSNLM